ncbi:RNaseH domain-containing protein [Actinopolyspora halophila]|uniref:RNaseH domain-containing protein n=1 Tax=Actinopolyspora halophila TaxID=1850 RepID=UPI0003A2404D|nr:RNaseH domain-containing protein [Actinopolyspora halophila]
MASSNSLYPLVLHVDDLDGHPLTRYRACTFPHSWAETLRRTVFRPDDDISDHPRGIPLWAVNNAIHALLPQLLTHDASGARDAVWLAWSEPAGTHDPDKALLVEFVRGGLIAAAHHRNTKARSQGRKPVVDLETLAAVVASFESTDLVYTDIALHTRPGRSPHEADFTLLPHFLGAYLLSTGWHVEHYRTDAKDTVIPEGTSRWRRTAHREGCEMISFPLNVETDGNNRWHPWSYFLQLSTQTHTWDHHPRIHIHLGTRRWTRRKVFDPSRSIGVHLFPQSPWNSDTEPVIGVTSMRWQPGPGGRNGRLVWNDDLAAVLDRLTPSTTLPDPAALARYPLSYLGDRNAAGECDHPTAGIPFRYGLGENNTHSVGTGVSAQDRHRIFTQLHRALSEFTRPAAPYTQIAIPTQPRLSAKQTSQVDSQQLAAAIDTDSMEVTLWHDDGPMRSEILHALGTTLDISIPPETMHPQTPNHSTDLTFPGEHLTITLRLRPVGRIAAALTINQDLKYRADRIAAAARERRPELERAMAASAHPDTARYALIIMGSATTFPSEEHDPKPLVKAVAARQGILTQNITPAKPLGRKDGQETPTQRTERAHKAVADLFLRQNGLARPPTRLGTTHSPLNNITHVGLWIVRRNGDSRAVLPLAVGWLPTEPFVRIRLPQHNEWLPSRQALLALAGWDTSRIFTDEQVQRFFADVVTEISDGSDTALFTLAQNLRPNCPGINNQHLTPDVLAFAPNAPLEPSSHKGVRHLRLRTNQRSETPQVYAYPAHEIIEKPGHAQGLWSDPDEPRRFYSTPQKPRSAGKDSPRGSRVEHRWGRLSKSTNSWDWRRDTREKFWNPRVLEILVASHESDDIPEAWAALAHQLRTTALHFTDPLALPLVLHLAHHVGEYLLPHHTEPIENTDH